MPCYGLVKEWTFLTLKITLINDNCNPIGKRKGILNCKNNVSGNYDPTDKTRIF